MMLVAMVSIQLQIAMKSLFNFPSQRFTYAPVKAGARAACDKWLEPNGDNYRRTALNCISLQQAAADADLN